MKKLFGILALAMSVSACGLGDAVEDLKDAVKNAADQAKVEKVFDSAITQVTMQVLDVALEQASAAVTAPTAPLSAQADIGTVSVDESVTTDEGATVTVKGTVSGSLSDEEATLTLEFDTTWSGLKVVLDNGATVTTSGSQKISGSYKVVEGVVFVEITNKGNITIDGKSYAFEITFTYDSGTNIVAYSGTVNGFPVIRTVTLPAGDSEDGDEEEYAQCKHEDGDVCIAYTTAEYACEDLEDATYTAVTDCESESEWLATCTIKDHSVQYFNFDAETDCTSKGGVWEEL